jgi:hypothetical protein
MAEDRGSPLERIYGVAIILGQITGILFLLAGVVLCILGISGAVDLIVEGGGIGTKLLNGSPGVVLAFLGFLILWRYKPRISFDRVEHRQRSGRGGGSSLTRDRGTASSPINFE